MAKRFYNYAQLIKLDTKYARRMEALSNRIFGNPVKPTDKESMRVVHELSLKPVDKRDHVINWYPRHPETHKLVMALRDYGLFRDEHEDFKDEMLRQKALRGKLRKPGEKKKAKVSG